MEEKGAYGVSSLSSDDQAIIDAGYRPSLRRNLGFFASFAIMFSNVSVLMGIFSNFGYVMTKAGPFGFWTWPVVGCGQLLVALLFAELAGRMPLAGAIYNWNRRVLGSYMGWLSALLVLFAYCTGGAGLLIALLTPLQSLIGHEIPPATGAMIGIGLVLSHILINIYGVSLAALVNKIAVAIEILALVIFGGLLLAVVFIHHEAHFDLLTTIPPGPAPYGTGFVMSSLLAAWTLLGFEVPSDLSEETINATGTVPRSIFLGVLSAVLLGGFFLLALTLAIPDVAQITAAGDPISAIIAAHLGEVAMKIFLVCVIAAMYALSLLIAPAGSRVLYAVARDGHMIGAAALTRISAHKVPVVAIFVVAAIELAIFLTAREAVDLYVADTILFYIVYLVTVAGFAFGLRKLPPPGEFSLSRWRSPILIAALLWLPAMIGVLTLPQEFHRAALIAFGIVAIGVLLALTTRGKRP